MRNKLKILFLAVAPLFFYGCSDDDQKKEEVNQICYPTYIEMTINGEPIQMEAMGRGIMLTQNGYILDLGFGHYKSDPTKEVAVSIELPYKKLGKNLLTNFSFHYYLGNEYFSGNITHGVVNSEVISNTNKCFYMTFSATLTNNDKIYEIKDGIIKYTYEEPF